MKKASRGELMYELENLDCDPSSHLVAGGRNRAIAYHHAAKKLGIKIFVKKWGKGPYIVWRIS